MKRPSSVSLLRLLAIPLLLSTGACSGMHGSVDLKPGEDPPGWFDVGFGYGFANNVRSTEEDRDADGFMLSVKAYPFRKWYRNRLSSSVTYTNEDADTMSAILMTDEAPDIATTSGILNRATQSTVPDGFETVKGYDGLLNRFAIFYGRSAGNFVSADGDSHVDAVGVSFDIAPQFALQIGIAMHRFDKDVDGSLFFGVTLNATAIANVFGYDI